MAEQLELPFRVIDGGKPEPYFDFKKKYTEAVDAVNKMNDKGEVPKESLPKTA